MDDWFDLVHSDERYSILSVLWLLSWTLLMLEIFFSTTDSSLLCGEKNYLKYGYLWGFLSIAFIALSVHLFHLEWISFGCFHPSKLRNDGKLWQKNWFSKYSSTGIYFNQLNPFDDVTDANLKYLLAIKTFFGQLKFSIFPCNTIE